MSKVESKWHLASFKSVTFKSPWKYSASLKEDGILTFLKKHIFMHLTFYEDIWILYDFLLKNRIRNYQLIIFYLKFSLNKVLKIERVKILIIQIIHYEIN